MDLNNMSYSLFFNSAISIPNIIWPLIGGFLMDRYGSKRFLVIDSVLLIVG